MAGDALAKAVRGPARARHGDAGLESTEQGEAEWRVPVRRLRSGAVRIRHEVREWHGLAQLFRTEGRGDRDDHRSVTLDDENRGSLQPLRRSPGTRVRGWSGADWLEVLHERRGHDVHAERGVTWHSSAR